MAKKREVKKCQMETASLFVGERIAFNHGERATKSMRPHSVLSYLAMFNGLVSSESDISRCSVCSSDVCVLSAF
jgi:hypothetical protein